MTSGALTQGRSIFLVFRRDSLSGFQCRTRLQGLYKSIMQGSGDLNVQPSPRWPHLVLHHITGEGYEGINRRQEDTSAQYPCMLCQVKAQTVMFRVHSQHDLCIASSSSTPSHPNTSGQERLKQCSKNRSRQPEYQMASGASNACQAELAAHGCSGFEATLLCVTNMAVSCSKPWMLCKCSCTLAVLGLCLGHECFLARRNHLQLYALQHIPLAEPCKTLEQHATLSALAHALHVLLVPLDRGTGALVHLRRERKKRVR